jgi:uncharacterized protein (DUF1501 family)
VTDSVQFSRRQFMGVSLAVVSAVSTVPAFLDRQLLAAGLEQGLTGPGVPEDRVLVVVQLSGGNDGLNTVVPFGLKEYYDARPRIAIAGTDTLRLDPDKGVGLNKEMTGLKGLYDDGMLTVVQGVGYPNPNRSHFSSMDIWHTADPAAPSGYGWIGKSMDAASEAAALGKLAAPYCVAIGARAPLATLGRSNRAVSFENINLFRWSGATLHPALAQEYDRMNRAEPTRISDQMAQSDPAAFIARTSLDAQISSDKIRDAVGKPVSTAFPDGPLCNQLKLVAAMIRSDLKTRVYYVNLGGFDTHANQNNGQSRQLRELGTAMQAFYRELKATGHQDRVLSMVFSEFGRRVQENASQGTDHGTAGPMFFVGPMVRPGVIGAHPGLAKADLDNGDLKFKIDFRSAYANVLDGWMKINSEKALGAKFGGVDVLKG